MRVGVGLPFFSDSAILLFAVLLIIGVLAAKFSLRIGLPSLTFFIAVGMILNRFIYFDNASLTQFFGTIALTIILFEGGLQTKWVDMRPVLKPSATLATVGVALTTVVTGVCAKFILGVSWLEGMLFGAIVGSTDAAAVFMVLGEMNIKKRLTSTLEAESGSNDPMAVILTISFIQLIQTPDASYWSLLLTFVLQMGIGLALGFVIGKLSVWAINKINLDSSGLYPVLSLACAILTYSFTALVGGSGFLAVYIAGIIVGNADLTFRQPILRFNEGLAWMMQILMFILLGLLVFPQDLLEVTWHGLALSALLMFVARPIAVYLSTLRMGFSFKEKVVLSWAGLRGAVPVVLGTYPLAAGLEHGQLFFNVVFFVVFTSALVQGASLSKVAAKLGLVEDKKPTAPHSLELVSIGQTNAEMMQIHLDEGRAVSEKTLSELDLSENTLVTAVVRGERLITPHGNTTLKAGDILYVLVAKDQRERVKNIFLAEKEEREVVEEPT